VLSAHDPIRRFVSDSYDEFGYVPAARRSGSELNSGTGSGLGGDFGQFGFFGHVGILSERKESSTISNFRANATISTYPSLRASAN
jgi:hypothetical protein